MSVKRYCMLLSFSFNAAKASRISTKFSSAPSPMDSRKSVSSIMIGGACLLKNVRFQDSRKGI